MESHDASLLDLRVQGAGRIVHMTKLVSPIEGECQPVTRCGCVLSMPWELVGEEVDCMACLATHTE